MKRRHDHMMVIINPLGKAEKWISVMLNHQGLYLKLEGGIYLTPNEICYPQTNKTIIGEGEAKKLVAEIKSLELIKEMDLKLIAVKKDVWGRKRIKEKPAIKNN